MIGWRPANLPKIRNHLLHGGVVAYPTESCYGLGCDPMNHDAVARLLRIKRRPREKGLILIAGKLAQLQRYGAIASGDLSRYWPGPYTLLIEPKKIAPKWLIGRHAKIALRLTAHREAAGLCNGLGMALVSTSANFSGKKPAKSHRQCAKIFGPEVLVVPGRIGNRKKPSTIVDLASGGILRS